jgi:hypothetical protein
MKGCSNTYFCVLKCYLLVIKCFTTSKKSIALHLWRAPKFLGRPKMGPNMLKNGSSWNLVSFPASNTKGGKRGVLKAPGLD